MKTASAGARGRICSNQFLDPTDGQLRSKLAEHIVIYWQFAPATREAKPVAAFVRADFNHPRKN
jgi:hypothetical protein